MYAEKKKTMRVDWRERHSRVGEETLGPLNKIRADTRNTHVESKSIECRVNVYSVRRRCNISLLACEQVASVDPRVFFFLRVCVQKIAHRVNVRRVDCAARRSERAEVAMPFKRNFSRARS